VTKPKLETVETTPPVEEAAPAEKASPIAKPSAFSLDKFKAKRTGAEAIATLQAGLPHYKFAAANDFVRLHPDEDNYWSEPLCFVPVPVKGTKDSMLHLIDESIALQNLPIGKLSHFRLALASKPLDIFFLCHIPTRNLDNKFNATTLRACELAKTTWVQLTSLKAKGIEDYELTLPKDPNAVPLPKWPTQSLSELIDNAFQGCQIDREDHPALLRLILARQSLS
jgi:hypothetical protein